MSLSPIEQYQQRKSVQTNRLRMVSGVVMGSFILLVGLAMFFANRLNLGFVIGLEPLLRYLFGGLCLVYGSFRVWRAFQP